MWSVVCVVCVCGAGVVCGGGVCVVCVYAVYGGVWWCMWSVVRVVCVCVVQVWCVVVCVMLCAWCLVVSVVVKVVRGNVCVVCVCGVWWCEVCVWCLCVVCVVCLPKDFWRRSIWDMAKRWAKCVAAAGEYFEGRGLEIPPLPTFLNHSEDDWSDETDMESE